MNVPPVSCSPVSLLVRAAAASASLWTRISRRPRVSALWRTGTIRPSSSATAIPMLTSPWRTIASGSKLAFTPGWRRRARATALVTKSPSESLISSAASCLLSSSRAATSSVDADVDGHVDLGSGLLGLDHPLGDRLAHPRVRDALGGQRGRPAGGDAGCGAAAVRRRSGRRGRACGGPGLALEKRLDVAADDPAAGAGAAHLAEVDLDAAATFRASGLALTRPQPGRVCRPPAVAVAGPWPCWPVRRAEWPWRGACRGLGARRPPSAFGGRRRRGASLAAQTQRLGDLLGVLALLGQDHHALAQRDFLTGGMVDVHDRAVVVRLHRHRGLVGLDVGQRVAFLDLVADLDQPLGDHAGLHRGAELGHRDFDRHGSFSLQVRNG